MSHIDLSKFDATEIARLIRTHEVTASEALDWAVDAVDSRDEGVNAVWDTFPERARKEIERGLPVGPFSGVPFMIKDLGLRLEGVPTTCGSRFFADDNSKYSSELVKRYQSAGLVIFGKTATSEFGLGPSADTDLYPRTNNPWNRLRIAGGSSSGSAAAVASGTLPIVHASDGGGSIRIPAACCGVFGMKPSRGRITYAQIAESWSGMSTQHAISRTVRDNAALLDVTHGGLPGDPYFCPPPPCSFVDAAAHDPHPLLIGFHLTSADGIDPEPSIRDGVLRMVTLLEGLGHHLMETRPDFDLSEVALLYGTITASTITMMIEDRVNRLGREPRQDELLEVTRQIYSIGLRKRAVDLARTREACFTAAREIAAFTERFDVILCPTIAQLPPKHGALDMRNESLTEYMSAIFRFAPYTAPASLAGQPAMNVPVGLSSDGLPLGAHFSAAFGYEHLLYSLAGQIERAQPWVHLP